MAEQSVSAIQMWMKGYCRWLTTKCEWKVSLGDPVSNVIIEDISGWKMQQTSNCNYCAATCTLYFQEYILPNKLIRLYQVCHKDHI